ncbi:hypothetical protein BB934_02925 [Microvirga ossetica]|uniref:Uncharacterized protein n=1 Tax=Microvirga ossetica TaxID=1882682 RepID=A0A1B2EBE8_9HYPH|nr:hypothetical protein [Microvirga ossetica]ANY77304.1 hypothetical protein BB934_02925 [Microvirga ossetica]
MPREVLRDPAGRVIGSYEDNAVSGRITARDASGRWLGYYDTRRDETRDAAGRFLAKGNVLASLIFGCEGRR